MDNKTLPGSQPFFGKWWLLLDHDKPLLENSASQRLPILYQSAAGDFQGNSLGINHCKFHAFH